MLDKLFPSLFSDKKTQVDLRNQIIDDIMENGSMEQKSLLCDSLVEEARTAVKEVAPKNIVDSLLGFSVNLLVLCFLANTFFINLGGCRPIYTKSNQELVNNSKICQINKNIIHFFYNYQPK
ncbi:hypothetical protein ACWATR_38295 [Nostoc sp. UIC 10890]